jgi:hypothetical protein
MPGFDDLNRALFWLLRHLVLLIRDQLHPPLLRYHLVRVVIYSESNSGLLGFDPRKPMRKTTASVRR